MTKKKYFGINFEFNHLQFERKILETIKQNNKGYCCFVDLNSLVNAHENKAVLNVLNGSMQNSCDGSYIAMISSIIHKERLKEYIGPDFFAKYIYSSNKQLIIGNTETVFKAICDKVKLVNSQVDNLNYLPLPFVSVDAFDYEEIAQRINTISPDIIWVSLGAPKQELFMSMLEPKINRGVLVGVGAATNYFSGEINDIPSWTKHFHVIWIYRLFTEPKKQISRMAKVIIKFPRIIVKELISYRK